jgi:hypothetical protein
VRTVRHPCSQLDLRGVLQYPQDELLEHGPAVLGAPPGRMPGGVFTCNCYHFACLCAPVRAVVGVDISWCALSYPRQFGPNYEVLTNFSLSAGLELLVEVLADPVGAAALGLDEGGEPCEQIVDLSAVVRAEGESRDVCEVKGVGCQFRAEQPGDRFQGPGTEGVTCTTRRLSPVDGG